MRASTFEHWNLGRQRQGLSPWDPTLEYHLRPVPGDQVDIEVDTSLVADRVVAGLLEHKSQRDVLLDPGIVERRWARMASRESSVTAWPSRPPDSPLLTNLFQGF
jgi:hypothetical protein